jgi:hypothetical protein
MARAWAIASVRFAESPPSKEDPVKDYTSAIMESDGERVEKSIGKPARPGRLGSRQVV